MDYESNKYNANHYEFTSKTPVVTIEPINEWVPIPHHETSGSAGVDLRAAVKGSKTIMPNETVKIEIGLRLEIPDGYFGMLVPRSGLATKQGLVLANTVGVIDSDYRGEIIVSVYNRGSKPCVIETGDRIAQLILIPYLAFNAVEGKLSTTERDTGGFGSTGVK